MSSIIKIMKNAVKRNRMFVFIALLGAIMICICFKAFTTAKDMLGSKSGSDRISVGVVDNDKSPLSDNFKEYLSDNLNMNVQTGLSFDEQSRLLINTDISAIIEIPQGFNSEAVGGTVKPLTVTTVNDYENIAFIRSYIDIYLQSLSVAVQASGGSGNRLQNILSDISQEEVAITTENAVAYDEDETTAAAFEISSGFFLMIVMSVCMLVSFTVFDDKSTKTYERMQISNVKPYEYIIGTAVFGAALCILLGAVPLATIFIHGYSIGISYGLAVLIYLLYILFVIGFALLLSMLEASKMAISTIVIGFATIGCILGGAWFPITDNVGVLKNFSYIMPQYWFMDIIKRKTADPDSSCISNLIILALFAVLMYLISAMIYTKKKNR